jgi:hypothetical protein
MDMGILLSDSGRQRHPFHFLSANLVETLGPADGDVLRKGARTKKAFLEKAHLVDEPKAALALRSMCAPTVLAKVLQNRENSL